MLRRGRTGKVEGWDSSDALKKEEEDGEEEKRVEQSRTSK